MEAINVIVGASGQVGSHVLSEIKKKGLPVRAVVRNPDKLADRSVDTRVADLFNTEQMIHAFEGGSNVFLITPEDPSSNDVLGDTQRIVDNYRKAIEAAGIKKIVGISCVGAHVEANTGNILMSRILEQTLADIAAQKVFIRPNYYYSNWLGFVESVKESGVLPAMFPEDFSFPMHSPIDVAKLAAQVMTDNTLANKNIYELKGPQDYSPRNVADAMGKLLNKKVTVQTIPEDKWVETMRSVGFSENAAINFADMTRAVLKHTTPPEFPDDMTMLPTTLEEHLKTQMSE